MPIFDFYIMVDWSGSARRRGDRLDAIWIAFGPIQVDVPVTQSPFSRTEAISLIREILRSQFEVGHRTLLCFDFAYGFPRDFAAAL